MRLRNFFFVFFSEVGKKKFKKNGKWGGATLRTTQDVPQRTPDKSSTVPIIRYIVCQKHKLSGQNLRRGKYILQCATIIAAAEAYFPAN